MSDNKSLSSSLEDYLEAILVIETKQRVARVSDIANYLDVQMPSVTGAVKNLKKKGLVEYEKNSFIYLSAKGKKLAENIFGKHGILLKFFEQVLLVPQKKAEEQACQIEHFIDSETALKLQNCTELLLSGLETEKFYTKEEWSRKIKMLKN